MRTPRLSTYNLVAKPREGLVNLLFLSREMFKRRPSNEVRLKWRSCSLETNRSFVVQSGRCAGIQCLLCKGWKVQVQQVPSYVNSGAPAKNRRVSCRVQMGKKHPSEGSCDSPDYLRQAICLQPEVLFLLVGLTSCSSSFSKHQVLSSDDPAAVADRQMQVWRLYGALTARRADRLSI